MNSLSLDQAVQMLAAARADARTHRYRPMGIVVLDATGLLVASVREDGASALRLDIALGKAGAAIGMGVNSRTLAQRADAMPIFFGAIAATAQHKFIPQTGAVLAKDAAGKVLGAIGASGGTGDEDEQICTAAVVALGFTPG
jgi:uncharacterized protein GlcG (DUF336 family)